MIDHRRRCPVCHGEVRRSGGGNIAPHRDSLDIDQCPATGEPFRIAEKWWPRARQRNVLLAC